MTDMLMCARFWWTFVLACALPYGMYVIAYIFESRKPGSGPRDVPVWRDQSKAFLPGDMGLAWLLAVSLYVEYHKPFQGWMLLVGTAVGWVVYILARRFTYTPEDYDRRAWNSPSKKYHDIVMYVSFVMLLVAFAVPAYFGSWGDGMAVRLLGMAGLWFWVVCMIIDLWGSEVPNGRQHPIVYQPIWRTWRERRQAQRSL